MINCHALTDIGKKRKNNEDDYLCNADIGLFVVADGVGGRAHGEIASAMTIEAFEDSQEKVKKYTKQFIENPGRQTRDKMLNIIDDICQLASSNVYEMAEQKQYKGMTTTVVLTIIAGGYAFIAHVGDSRVYVLRDDKLHQLTEDHSMVNELVRSGQMTREQASQGPYRNVIVRAVGMQPNIKTDVAVLELIAGDRLVLCSDGLSDPLPSNDIAKITSKGEPRVAVENLIQAALDAGGPDNVTAIVIEPVLETKNNDAMARVKAMQEFFLFKGLPFNVLVRVSRMVSEMPVETGQVIVEQGSLGQCMYVVVKGTYLVEHNNVALSTFGEGDHFGELSLVDNQPRSASVIAKEEGSLICIDRQALDKFCQREPELGCTIVWKLSETIASRLRSSNVRLTNLEHDCS
ncbi:MAG: Stp1/IreP family PP2C-type Ser/Thr phosphatase [Methylococcales bacterium]|jgi:serine/threonine protein phosphatase PrpC|nr:Stp1/IreP family PP2C-type Ser/Thr phosphatase [Methylococcales bacterium]MBT7410895.1 Stp1/IreP family PP2C-type Ser/Thr phosphatase [Methylococcales bacterium]